MYLRFWYIFDIGIFAIKVYSDTIIANGSYYTHLRFRYTCDDNRNRFAIFVALHLRFTYPIGM